LFFKSSKEKKHSNLKGRVQCNEECLITLQSGESFKGRINEFNWVGFVVDFIDGTHKEIIHEAQNQEIRFDFKLPREFGHITVSTKVSSVIKYQEIITNDERLKFVVSMEGKPEIELLQEFVNYRNRGFARHSISRKSIASVNQTIFLTFIYIVSAILFIAILISMVYLKFY
jgi:hypothetical protein